MKLYLFLMALASVFGFLKAVAVANIVSIADFGNYATVLGASMFLTMGLSLGEIEGTIKRFPRLWVDKDTTAIASQSSRIGMLMLRRSAILLAASTLVAYALTKQDHLPFVLMTVILGYLGILVRLESAQLLAIGDTHLIARFSLARSAFAILAASAGGALFGWDGAIAGEILAAVATVVQAKISLRPYLGRSKGHVPAVSDHSGRDTGLYAAALLSSAPSMLDKAVVAAAAGALVAGHYGFAMVLAQVGQVVTNIVGQRVGPEIIRLRKQDGNPAAGIKLLLKASLATVLLSVAAPLVFLTLVYFGIGSDLADKYSITIASALLAGFLGAASVFVLAEYAVIAADREREVLRGSAAAFCVFAVGFVYVAGFGGGVEAFVGVACLARLVQVLWLAASIRRDFSRTFSTLY